MVPPSDEACNVIHLGLLGKLAEEAILPGSRAGTESEKVSPGKISLAVGALLLLGRLHTPQALLLWLALPPLLPGSPIPERCHHLIVSTISWALRLAGLALAPAKPHMDAMAIADDVLH